VGGRGTYRSVTTRKRLIGSSSPRRQAGYVTDRIILAIGLLEYSSVGRASKQRLDLFIPGPLLFDLLLTSGAVDVGLH